MDVKKLMKTMRVFAEANGWTVSGGGDPHGVVVIFRDPDEKATPHNPDHDPQLIATDYGASRIEYTSGWRQWPLPTTRRRSDMTICDSCTVLGPHSPVAGLRSRWPKTQSHVDAFSLCDECRIHHGNGVQITNSMSAVVTIVNGDNAEHITTGCPLTFNHPESDCLKSSPRPRTCLNCGARFLPPETDGNGMCSDDCATDARKQGE